jgi:outer membrane protein assembly factor BamB
VLCACVSALLVGAPATAAAQTGTAPWPQFQGGPGRTADGSQAPAPPYRVSWHAATGLGDPTHWSGFPTPIVAAGLAIVVGRDDVTAVDVDRGSVAWTIPRAIGTSSPPAVVGTTLVYLEGGGDESVSASSSPSVAPPAASSPASASTSPSRGTSASRQPSASANTSTSPSAPANTSVSTLVAVDVRTHEPLWTAELDEVSHTGVLAAGDTVVVGTDDGQVSAFAVDDGSQRWSVDAGDHVLAPMAASSDAVIATVRPESGAPYLLALQMADGTQAWRYDAPRAVLDLGGPSVAGDTVYVVGSDASVRAVSLDDGTQRWASPLYTPTLGSPPGVVGDGLYVTDQVGTVYGFDAATGAERWRFATNRNVVGAPIVAGSAVLQPTVGGSVVAIDVTSGHQVWEGSLSDSVVIGLAASGDAVVASLTGASPGLTALVADPTGAPTDIASPTTPQPANLLAYWLLAAVPLAAASLLFGRWLDRRMGPAELGSAEDVVDPRETDHEDDT